MPSYSGYVALVGSTEGDKRKVEYEIDAPDAILAAVALENLETALQTVSDGGVQRVAYSNILTENTIVQVGDDGVDCFELAVLTLAATGNKKVTHRIPAPKPSIFNADKKTVDVTNADLQAYVATLAASVTLSDGDTIDTAAGNGGILYGKKVSVARSF